MSVAVRTVYNKSWIPYPNKVEYHLDNQMKEFPAPVTTVHIFLFDRVGELLMVRHKLRGWEVPGGHVEVGESYEEAMHRELWEEAQVKVVKFEQLGYLKKMATGSKPEDCLYPYPESYCIFYGGLLEKEEEFCGDEFIVERGYFNKASAQKYPWIKSYEEYFEAALRIIF